MVIACRVWQKEQTLDEQEGAAIFGFMGQACQQLHEPVLDRVRKPVEQ